MKGVFKMEDKELVIEIKNKLVETLSEALSVYGQDWINRENCLELIDNIKTGKPVIMSGPFWGDALDAVFNEFGINMDDKETYMKFLKLLKEG